MKMTTSIQDDNVLLVQLREVSLDASNVQAFKDLVQPSLRDHSRVVVDLEGVRFIDSSGIGAFLSCMRQMNEQNGQLRLCVLSNTVIALFALMRLDRVFHIYASRAEAIAFDSSERSPAL